ncbi:Alpha-muurolene synthase [Marasmius tenuissimus]|nr:Alpha-muurolene synthase [Marasmius tenuissimus]
MASITNERSPPLNPDPPFPIPPEVAPEDIPHREAPDHFILPDLPSHCTFPLIYHPNGDDVAAQAVNWLNKNCPNLTEKRREALFGLQAGELTAYCYNTAADHRLRVVSDFMNYLFHLDNISDGMMTKETDDLADSVMNALWYTGFYRPTAVRGKKQPEEELNAGKLARDFWGRAIQEAGPGAQARFKETFELFFEAVNKQATWRDKGKIPKLKKYVNVRRDTSGCKPCWALIEYALGIDLPDVVAYHPVIKALNEHTNDLVTWSNDIFSFNVEQARGDTHNMIVIYMKRHGYSLQDAVDTVGKHCENAIKNFSEARKKLPTVWHDEDGNEVPVNNDEVQQYVKGLQDWIVGSLHWSYMTTRYFGTEGQTVKDKRYVKLKPVNDDAHW